MTAELFVAMLQHIMCGRRTLLFLVLESLPAHKAKEVRDYVAFTRAGDTATQAFARELGAVWAGASEDDPPTQRDAAINFAPVGSLVSPALRAVRKGGRVVCAGIHMSDIPSFPYSLLWEDRQVVSVANLTRRTASTF